MPLSSSKQSKKHHTIIHFIFFSKYKFIKKKNLFVLCSKHRNHPINNCPTLFLVTSFKAFSFTLQFWKLSWLPIFFSVLLLSLLRLSFIPLIFLFQLLSTVTTSISVFNKTPYIHTLFSLFSFVFHSLIWFCFHGVMNAPTPLDPREGLCTFLFIHQDQLHNSS